MSRHQLKQLFKHFDGEFSTTPSALNALKKKALLALKSSKDGFLTTENKRWAKGELLELFESDLSNTSFDYDALRDEIPELTFVENPYIISRKFDQKSLDSIPNQIPALLAHCTKLYYEDLYLAVRKDLVKMQFRSAENKLSYTELFEPVRKAEFYQKIQAQIIQLVRFKGNKLKSVKFLLEEEYYSFMLDMGLFDRDYMREQFLEMGFWIRRMSPRQRTLFFDLQEQLPYDSYDLLEVKDTRANYELLHENHKSEGSSDGVIQLLARVVVFAIIIFYFYNKGSFTSNRGFNNNQSNHSLDDPKLDDIMQRIGIDSDDTKDSIREKVRSYTTNQDSI